MGQQVLPPGFRFHPTDQELVVHYLRKKALSGICEDGVIGEVDLYKLEPWDLPGISILQSRDPEWYFFNARDKKYPHGSRTNRATRAGFWKATGKDRKVTSRGCTVGMKKTLVFYMGRAPSGGRTDWIMHEYRLDEEYEKNLKTVSCFVLCRIHKKNGLGPRNGDQYGAAVLGEDDETASPSEDIIPDVANHNLPLLRENERQDEFLDVLKPNLPVSGFLGTSSHVTTDVDCEGIEGLGSGEELESFLQSLLSYEAHDADLNYGPETQVVADFRLGPVEGHMKSSGQYTALLEEDALKCNEETVLVETGHFSTTEPFSEVPSLMDRGVYGLDLFHDFLHPASNEAEILGEIYQSIGEAQGEISSVMDHLTDQKIADETDLAGDDYLELADIDHSLDENFWTLPVLEMEGTSQNAERSINHRDTLQRTQVFDAEHGQFPSSEVLILTSGDLKDVKSAVNLHRRHNGDCTFVAMSSGTDLESCSASDEVQSIRPCIKVNDTSERRLLNAVPKFEQDQLQFLQAESSTVMELRADDGDVVAAIESSSAGQALNVFQGEVTARMAVISSAKLMSEDACGPPDRSSQPNDLKTRVMALVPSSSEGSPSSASPSLPQIPRFLLKFLHVLGNAPILPASAVEMSLSQGPVKCVHKGTPASECASRDGIEAGPNGSVPATAMSCHCKVGADNVSAPLPCGCSCVVTSTDVIWKATPNLLEGAKQLDGSSLIQCKCLLNVSSSNKFQSHRGTSCQITPLTEHGELWKTLFNGLTVFFFWGTTSVLIFFCLLRGFCRLTKSALTIF